MLSSHYDNVDMVRFLLDNKVSINQEDSEEKTALLKATYYGNVEVVKLLIEKGANIYHMDKRGNNIINLSTQNDNTLSVIELLCNG